MGQPGCNTHGFSPSQLGRMRRSSVSCGGSCSTRSIFGGEKEKELTRPVWKAGDDKIIFYASTLKCKGSTNWCIDHCVSKTSPFPFDIKKITPIYSIAKFVNISNQLFKEDFLKVRYVTLLGTGTLETIDSNVEAVITELPQRWVDKLFRFFIRTPIKKIKIGANAKVIFSADKDTEIDYLEWAIKAPQVNAIAVVKHKDNKILISYLKTKVSKIIDCSRCLKMNCVNFKGREKRLVLMNYIG